MKSFKRTVLWTLGVIVLMAVFFYGSTETTAGAAAERAEAFICADIIFITGEYLPVNF